MSQREVPSAPHRQLPPRLGPVALHSEPSLQPSPPYCDSPGLRGSRRRHLNSVITVSSRLAGPGRAAREALLAAEPCRPGPPHSLPRLGHVTCCANEFLGFVEDLITWVRGWRHVLALPRQQRVVLLPIIVCVKEFLKPLNKLKIILEFSFH